MVARRKLRLPPAAALLLGVLLSSFGPILLARGGFGLSPTSCVPFVLSLRFRFLSYGGFTVLFQWAWMLVPILCLRWFRQKYWRSFALTLVYAPLLDFWLWALAGLPQALALRVLWYALGFFCLSLGIALMNRSGLPSLPFLMAPRAFVNALVGVGPDIARGVHDLINLTAAAALSLLFFGSITVIGIGTVLCVLSLGMCTGKIAPLLDRFLIIEPHALLF